MGLRIEDGKGTGKEAGVNSDNKILTEATIIELGLAAAENGRAFFASTGLISLTTTGSYNGVLYLQNGHQTDDLHVAAGHIGTDSVAATFRFVRNPSAGTLISAGTDIVPVNMDFGSGASYIGDVKKGADGQTITDGDEIMLRQVGATEAVVNDAIRFLVLPPRTTLGISCKPSAAAVVNIGLLLFYHTR